MRDIIILGLGSMIRGDDSAGIRVVRLLKKRFPNPSGIDIKESDEAGINLLDILSGYRRAVIVDSIVTEESKEGTIHRFDIKELSIAGHRFSSHNIGLATLIEMARQMRIPFPQDIIIFAIEIRNSCYFSEKVTANIEKAVEQLTDLIEREYILEAVTQ